MYNAKKNRHPKTWTPKRRFDFHIPFKSHDTVVLSLSKDLCLFFHAPSVTLADLSTTLRYGRDDKPFFDALPEEKLKFVAEEHGP